ncbi:MAG: amidohydrolase family protein [Burkholderiales bacterium]|nr:amidohydrolase family protein [Burkholderiales bacterium]
MTVFDEPKIDGHCHLLDPERHPYAPDAAYRPAGQELGTLAQYRQVMDAYGIRHALLVGPNSGYGLDNRCLLDAVEQGGGLFKGIAVAPPDLAPAALAELQARGIVGLAFNAALLGTAHYLQAGALLRELARRDLLLSLQVEGDQLVELQPMLERSGVRVLVDHCGRPAAGRGLDQPGFRALLALARSGRVAVKLSGFQKFSTQPPPHEDTAPYVKALLQAYGLQACLWASDWPFLRAPQRIDVGPLLRGVERLLPDPADRRRLFWETPRRWLGF